MGRLPRIAGKLKSGRASLFTAFAAASSRAMGSPRAFALACLVVAVWGASGPHFHYSDTWQLVINTGTTIATFLLGFLVQYTVSRDGQATHIKLDALLLQLNADPALLSLDNLDLAQLEKIRALFTARAKELERLAAKRRRKAAP